jgi:hypothetical protein
LDWGKLDEPAKDLERNVLKMILVMMQKVRYVLITGSRKRYWKAKSTAPIVVSRLLKSVNF